MRGGGVKPKAKSISRSEILRKKRKEKGPKLKQEHKVSYRCSLPSPLQKRSKDFKGLQRLDRCQNPAGQQRTFLGLGAPHEPIFFGDWRASCSSLRSSYFHFRHVSPGGASDYQSSFVTLNPKRSTAIL